MTTLKTIRRAQTPPKDIQGKLECANGHVWCAETTRWRFRDRSDRPGHPYSGWERDCLECRRKNSATGVRNQR